MSDVPDHLRYTAEHEWVALVDDTTARVGITDHAQSALGDIVFVSVNAQEAALTAGETFGEVESTKSVSDLYAPVSGTVTALNTALEDSPELVNSDPYGEGWIAEVTVSGSGVLDGLLDAAGYRALIGE